MYSSLFAICKLAFAPIVQQAPKLQHLIFILLEVKLDLDCPYETSVYAALSKQIDAVSENVLPVTVKLPLF